MNPQRCHLKQIDDLTWQCRRCGRRVQTMRRPDGSVVQPRLDGLPPCGWRPLIFEAQAHLWVEQPPPVSPLATTGEGKAAVAQTTPLAAAEEGKAAGVSPVIPAQAGTQKSPLPSAGEGQGDGGQTTRRFRCQQCFQEITLPGQTPDADARQALAQQAACPRPRPQPPAAVQAVAPQSGKPPSLLQQAVNYSKAIAGWLAQGLPVRPPAEIERIFSICQACDRYDRAGHRCFKCGCAVNTSPQAWRNKIAMATESCPLGKW